MEQKRNNQIRKAFRNRYTQIIKSMQENNKLK